MFSFEERVESQQDLNSFKSVNPGDIITFGIYPQSVTGEDKTPIKWRVLKNNKEELFLLSEYILDCKQYHNIGSTWNPKQYNNDDIDITWKDSDLRKWLNTEFYNRAFSDLEKKLIKATHCTGNGEDTLNTDDKIFLLSEVEAKELTNKGEDVSLGARRRAIGTDFSKVKENTGCRLGVYSGKQKYNYIIENNEEFGCSWWWLRTQGNKSSRAYFVGTNDSIRSYGQVDLPYYGIRPAFKLDLSKFV